MKKVTWLLIFELIVLVFPCIGQKVDNSNSKKNVIYGHNTNYDGKDQPLDMDIYWPSKLEKGKKYPLLLLIHGGTFINGKKEGLGKACASIVDSGFVAVTINYRLGWKIPVRSEGCNADFSTLTKANYRAAQDTKAALRFLVDNADKFHIDKKWIFIGGGSAGGVTAMMVNYMGQDYFDKKFPYCSKELGMLDEGSNDSKATYKIAGMCNMWGGLSDSTLINGSNAVPTIFFHGTGDIVIPYEHGHWRGETCQNFPAVVGSACINRQIRKFNKPGLLNLIIGGKHGPVEYTHEQMMSNTACFLHSVVRGDAHSGEYTNVVVGCR
jgi:poly(3-hydroxybutyrate) depolymerase